MIPISFYILSDQKAQDFLGFICQLTQTALNKSHQSLLLLIEEEALLGELDEALWSYSATSFMPHQRLDAANAKVSHLHDSLAPILLAANMPESYNGIVLNTTTRPVNEFVMATRHATFTRILEIIKPDTASIEAGRAKYKYYQQLGYELTYFKV